MMDSGPGFVMGLSCVLGIEDKFKKGTGRK